MVIDKKMPYPKRMFVNEHNDDSIASVNEAQVASQPAEGISENKASPPVVHVEEPVFEEAANQHDEISDSENDN